MEKHKGIKCYQNNCGTYTIVIDQSVFEMSTNANQPNGVNMYCGELDDFPAFDSNKDMKLIQLGDLPRGTLLGIINRMHMDMIAKEQPSIKTNKQSKSL